MDLVFSSMWVYVYVPNKLFLKHTRNRPWTRTTKGRFGIQVFHIIVLVLLRLFIKRFLCSWTKYCSFLHHLFFLSLRSSKTGWRSEKYYVLIYYLVTADARNSLFFFWEEREREMSRVGFLRKFGNLHAVINVSIKEESVIHQNKHKLWCYRWFCSAWMLLDPHVLFLGKPIKI